MSAMRFNKIAVLCVCIGFSLAALYSDAQERKSADPGVTIRKLSKLNRMSVGTPLYDVSGGTTSRNRKEWLRILVTYDTEAEWIDDMSITYILMTQGGIKSKPSYSLYKLNVNYSDIKRGRGHIAAAFLTPPAVERYGSAYAVAVEITCGGKVVSSMTEKPSTLPDEWWKNPKIVDSNAVINRSGYLLNRKDTPFYLVNYDDYEVIK